jgi:shikimate dehydrogenase
MYPALNTCPPLPYECINSKHWLYDLVYNPELTLFLQKGKAQGANIKNGLEMLYLQAEGGLEYLEKDLTLIKKASAK